MGQPPAQHQVEAHVYSILVSTTMITIVIHYQET